MKPAPKGPRRNGRRPLPPEKKRSRILEVRLNESEYAALLKAAERAQMPLSTFLRAAGLKVRIAAPPSLENREAYAALGRIGQLLNQAIKAVHQGRVTNLDPAILKKLGAQVHSLRLQLLGADR